jgi:hypothetical protein
MVTLAPSEPILAKAAMEYLCSGMDWRVSIHTLVRQLLEKGLVEKGRKGELYARLVVILAHDWVRYRRGRQVSGGKLHQNAKFMKSFTVREFLEALYAQEGHESIVNIDPKILEARMNFTHFARTQEELRAEIFPELFVDLLRRGAALQLSSVQSTYDILIPIYLGKEEEALEPSKCSCIVIQVKNRIHTTTPGAILQEEFTVVKNREQRASESLSTKAGIRKASEIASTKAKKEEVSESASTKAEKEKSHIHNRAEFVFNQMENPILFLLFDFRRARTEKSIAPSVEVSYSSNVENVPRVWAIHSRGHDENVFGCLSLMDCVVEGEMFFASAVPDASEHDQIVRQNDVFRELERSFRVPEKSKMEDEDEDGDMGGC